MTTVIVPAASPGRLRFGVPTTGHVRVHGAFRGVQSKDSTNSDFRFFNFSEDVSRTRRDPVKTVLSFGVPFRDHSRQEKNYSLEAEKKALSKDVRQLSEKHVSVATPPWKSSRGDCRTARRGTIRSFK